LRVPAPLDRRLVKRGPLGARRAPLRPGDQADAVRAVMERDVPEPSQVRGLAENGVGVPAGQARRVPIIAKQGEVPQERVVLAEPESGGQPTGLPGAVGHQPGRELPGLAVLPGRGDFCAHPIRSCHRLLRELPRRKPLEHLDPAGASVVQQNLVEDRAHHLVGIGESIPFPGLIKVEGPGFGMAPPAEHPAFLAQKPGGLHGGQSPRLVQHVEHLRHQRLADVITGKGLPFQQDDGEPPPGPAARPGSNRQVLRRPPTRHNALPYSFIPASHLGWAATPGCPALEKGRV
jgi:hypothetical protein